MPDNKEITAGGTFNLTMSDALTFVVTVENQGNMDEVDVPVVVTISSSASAQPQRSPWEDPLAKGQDRDRVHVQGVDPSGYGDVALLRVEAGPVQGEKNPDNNWIEAHVIFKM